MRLLLRLKSIKDTAYENLYHRKFQGFVYSLLYDTDYHSLHDKSGYKFFCFSNIFPIGDIKEEDKRNLLLSSPDEKQIDVMESKLNSINGKNINIGEMSFQLMGVSRIKPRIENGSRLVSATPIVIRIPERNYKKYGIDSDKKYIYWRPEYAFEVFVRQLEENLFKKYNEFHKTNIEEFPVFEQFIFKKTVVNHILEDNREIKVIGSVWEFAFSHLAKEQKQILEFGIDAGFGERNPLGFGFMNVVR